jgi:cell division protein FtsB
MARMTVDAADDPPAPATPRARRRLRTAEEARNRRRRRITWGLSLALSALLVNSIVGENGYLANVRYRAEQAELEAAVTRLRLENQHLQEERRRLVEDPSALEEEARRSLGLIRPGETLLIVRPLPSATKTRDQGVN